MGSSANHDKPGVAPNVWTGCCSQVRACCRKSLICIRPVDRRVGPGLDGNTHAPLISLRDRLPGSHKGTDSGSVYRSVPWSSSIASSVETAARLPWSRGGVESLVVAQHAPGDAGELVGQRNGELVPVQPVWRGVEPRAEAISGPVMRAHQENLRSLDQQSAQIFATPLGDAAEDRPATSAVLSRYEPQPGGKIATALERPTSRSWFPISAYCHALRMRGSGSYTTPSVRMRTWQKMI
jgi:hypothetical protein